MIPGPPRLTPIDTLVPSTTVVGAEDVLEGRDSVRRRGDVAGRQIVELVHEPIERETPERHEEEREQPPGQQERRCREADQVQIEMEQAPQGGLSPDRDVRAIPPVRRGIHGLLRSEENTYELQSLMRHSYDIF